MFHITPTPTSWMLWAAIYVVAVLVIAGLAFLSISLPIIRLVKKSQYTLETTTR